MTTECEDSRRISDSCTAAERNGSGDYIAGDVVISSDPWTYTILPELLEKVCYRCLKVLPIKQELLQSDLHFTCPQCQIPIYCSNQCQLADWGEDEGKENCGDSAICERQNTDGGTKKNSGSVGARLGRHQMECEALRKSCFSRKDVLLLPSDFFLMLGSIKKLLKRQDGDDSFDCCVPATSRKFSCLLSHSEEISENEDRMEFVRELKDKLRLCLSPEEMPNDKEFLRIFGCLQINCFGIRTPFFKGVGEGLYLGPSMIDHSCHRNAVFLFDSTRIIIKAIANIPSISDVRISYTELFVPSCVRLRRFKTGYYFECGCGFCQDKKIFAELYSMKCGTPSCSTVVPLDERALLSCVECGKSSASDQSLSKARVLIRRYLEGIEEIDDRIQISEFEIPDIFSECQSIQRRCRKIFSSSNLLLGMVYDRQARLCVSLEEFEQALSYFQLSLPAFRAFFQPQDTKMAVQILMTGLAAFIAGCFDDAEILLEETNEILAICDGENRLLFEISLLFLNFLRSKLENSNLSVPVENLEFHILAQNLLTLLANVRIEDTFHLLHHQVQLSVTRCQNLLTK